MRRLYALAALLLLSGCGDDSQDVPRLVAISVSIGEPNLRVTKSSYALATGVDQFSKPFPTARISWTSDNPAVVVNDSGRVTAVAWVPEQIVIRATSDGHSGTAAMHTYPAPVLSQLDLSQSPSAVLVGGTLQLRVSGTDQSGDAIETGVITWTVRRTGVGDASVDAAGRITGLTAGDVVVRASVGSVQREKTIMVLAQ